MFAQGKTSWGWISDILEFVYPPLCAGCGQYVENGSIVCENCRDAIETFTRPFCLNCWQEVSSGKACPLCREQSSLLYAYGDYAGPLREVVIQFKFKGVTSVAAFLAEAISVRFGDSLRNLGADALVPIPLHSGREHVRGYNQARLLARELSRHLMLPVEDSLLSRVKRSRPQARLTEVKRRLNVRGVFFASEPPESVNRVILVDDVVTSGATVLEAKGELELAGYRVPAAVAAAHGL